MSLSAAAKSIELELAASGDPQRAIHSQRFFKTGPGEYGEGDVFLGITVPVVRKLVKQHADLDLETVEQLITSKYHEVRLYAVLQLVHQYQKSPDRQKPAIFQAYKRSFPGINNWDLVDASAPYLSGHYYFTRSRKPLYQLARSKNLWRRRIAIMSTFYFIRQADFVILQKSSADHLSIQEPAILFLIRHDTVGNHQRANLIGKAPYCRNRRVFVCIRITDGLAGQCQQEESVR